MKNLEKVRRYSIDSDGDVYADRDGSIISYKKALEAARLDNDAARAEGYRQGVEDSKSLGFLKLANSALKEAKRGGVFLLRATRQWEVSKWENRVLFEMNNYKMFAKAAFNGTRGIDRAEIRQRLERMEKSDER